MLQDSSPDNIDSINNIDNIMDFSRASDLLLIPWPDKPRGYNARNTSKLLNTSAINWILSTRENCSGISLNNMLQMKMSE